MEEIRRAQENLGMYTRKTSLEYEETDPIRFQQHKSQLIMLLTQVRESKTIYRKHKSIEKQQKDLDFR